LQGSAVVTQVAGLCGAAWGIVFGIKVKRYFLALVIGQGMRVAVLILQGKSGGRGTGRKGHGFGIFR
jgi:hypothetical protein